MWMNKNSVIVQSSRSCVSQMSTKGNFLPPQPGVSHLCFFESFSAALAVFLCRWPVVCLPLWSTDWLIFLNNFRMDCSENTVCAGTNSPQKDKPSEVWDFLLPLWNGHLLCFYYKHFRGTVNNVTDSSAERSLNARGEIKVACVQYSKVQSDNSWLNSMYLLSINEIFSIDIWKRKRIIFIWKILYEINDIPSRKWNWKTTESPQVDAGEALGWQNS